MSRALLCCLLSVLSLLSACSRKPGEQRIREAVAAMQSAMEARQPRDFMAYIANDFTGNDGTVDREQLHNILRAVALRNGTLGVTLGPLDIAVQGERATLDVTATFTGGEGGNLLPDRASIYSIHSAWKREGSEWRCYSAKWEQKL